MTDTEVALVLPEAGELALLEQDGRATRNYARESLSPAMRRACIERRLRIGAGDPLLTVPRPLATTILPLSFPLARSHVVDLPPFFFLPRSCSLAQ